MDRRTFLSRSGLTAGGLATLGALPLGSVRKAEAAAAGPAPAKGIIRQNMCTHCSVGCTVMAEVENGVWVGQEPGWDSPINRGSHCAKGAATREIVHGDRRLRYPMKMVNGQWQRISWDTAINEIGDKLAGSGKSPGPIPFTGWVRRSSPTSAPISIASSPRSGARTIPTTRRASAIRPPSRA